MSASHLVVLGNADAVRWVLANQRMAFSEAGLRGASRMARADTLFFYAGRSCWPALGGSRPTSGMVIGTAVVLTDAKRLGNPVQVGNRRFPFCCEVFFDRLSPIGTGVAFDSVRQDLDLTVGLSNYGQALRRTPVLLSSRDASLLLARLEDHPTAVEENIDQYLK